MRKVSAMDAERKYLRKELAKTVCRLKNTEKELEVARASLDFQGDGVYIALKKNVFLILCILFEVKCGNV